MPEKTGRQDAPFGGWWRLAGLGVEFAASVGAFCLVGYWIDRHWRTEPWGLLICALLGLIGGLYNLIRRALAAAAQAEKDRQRQHEPRDG